MKKGFTLLFVAFAISNAYSQNQIPGVGIGTTDPTATLDVDGTLRFRQGLPINAIQSLPLILGTDENGNVLPNKISDGLISTATGNLQVLPNPNGGVSVDSNGVSVKASNGILVDADGVAVNPGNGILVDADGVAVNPGEGISFNANNAIQVQPKENGGLLVDTNGITIKAGEAVYLENGEVNVGVGTGLTISNNKIILDPTYVTPGGNTDNIEIGNGLTYGTVPINGSLPVEVLAKPNSGIKVSNNGVELLASNGLYLDTNGLKVRASNGIAANANGVSVRAGYGITVNTNGVGVKGGAGIDVNSGGVDVNTGYGTVIDSNNGVAVNPGVGIMINENNAIDVKLASNSALKLENGLKVETDQAGGLKINNNQLGIAHDSSLKTSNLNTTAAVPFSQLTVNNSSSRGLGSDANGVYVKIGNGLAYNNGALTVNNTNTGTVTAAENGLTLSSDRTTVSLGGNLKRRTVIETSSSNTLALTGLQQAPVNYNNLVVNSNGDIQYAKPQILSTPVPALINVNNKINNFLANKTAGQTQLLSNLVIGFNFIGSNLTLNGSTLNIPAGIYQFNFVLEAGAQQYAAGGLGCDLSSYFMDFPTGDGTNYERIYMTAAHINGTGDANNNHGGVFSFTSILTRNTSWPLAVGVGDSGNCAGKTNLTIERGTTQLTILRMGDAPN